MEFGWDGGFGSSAVNEKQKVAERTDPSGMPAEHEVED